MGIIVNVQMFIKSGKQEQALMFLEKVLPDTRSYEGCQWVHCTTSMDEENKIEMFHMWDSKEKYDNYLQWRTHSGVMNETDIFLASDPVLRFFHVEHSF